MAPGRMHRRRLLVAVAGMTFAAGCGSADGDATTSPSAAGPNETETPARSRSTGTGTGTAATVRGTTTALTRTTNADPASAGGTPTATAATGSPGPADYEAAFVAALEDNGVTVTGLAVADRVTRLEYVSGGNSYEEIGAEIGMIAGSFFRQVERGWDVGRLESTLHDDSGSPQATWFADVDWLEQFRAGEIAAEELSTRILETLEPVE